MCRAEETRVVWIWKKERKKEGAGNRSAPSSRWCSFSTYAMMRRVVLVLYYMGKESDEEEKCGVVDTNCGC